MQPPSQHPGLELRTHPPQSAPTPSQLDSLEGKCMNYSSAAGFKLTGFQPEGSLPAWAPTSGQLPLASTQFPGPGQAQRAQPEGPQQPQHIVLLPPCPPPLQHAQQAQQDPAALCPADSPGMFRVLGFLRAQRQCSVVSHGMLWGLFWHCGIVQWSLTHPQDFVPAPTLCPVLFSCCACCAAPMCHAVPRPCVVLCMLCCAHVPCCACCAVPICCAVHAA